MKGSAKENWTIKEETSKKESYLNSTAKLSRQLNVFRLLLNNRFFFKELLDENIDMIRLLIDLLGCKNAWLGVLAF